MPLDWLTLAVLFACLVAEVRVLWLETIGIGEGARWPVRVRLRIRSRLLAVTRPQYLLAPPPPIEMPMLLLASGELLHPRQPWASKQLPAAESSLPNASRAAAASR